MAKVLITGGTGLIGTYLGKRLLEEGYEVCLLSRSKKTGTPLPTYSWNYSAHKIDKETFNSVDFIIHLAGANIGKRRWTTKRRQQILDSRVKSGELLLNSIIEQNIRIEAFISASAVGYYGAVTLDKIYTEDDSHFNDFIGNTCKSWEQVADKFQSTGIRTVKLRTGIVLTKAGGALEKLISPLKFGIGAVLGNGKQYLPWIHIEDLCDIYIRAIEDPEMKGTYNAVAPEHLSYQAFFQQLTISFHKPFLNINIPSFIMKIFFGKMSAILLNGTRVSSDKLVKEGYKFKFPSVQSALTDLLIKNTNE